MERTILDEIMLVCENQDCKEPLFIPVMMEVCLPFSSVLVCSKCNHRHNDLYELKQFSKLTRAYGHL
ncbi:MAG: hypothetical protein ACE3JQ_02500 [Paenisporosarcina sp.]